MGTASGDRSDRRGHLVSLLRLAALPSSSRRGLVGAAGGLVVVGAVILVVPWGIDRVFVPASLMLLGTVAATVIGRAVSAAPGVLAGAAALAFLYLPESTGSDGLDRMSLALYLVLGFGLSMLIAYALAREGRAGEQRALLEAELRTERAVTERVQLMLLPRRIPTVEGVRVAGRYVPAAGPDPLGGDWYAAVPLGPQRVGLAIGDVAGHGLEATATMAEVRFALRALAGEDDDPARVLERLNQIVIRFSTEMPFMTACYGVLDAGAGVWRQCSAGHLPTLVRAPDGTAEALYELTTGLPLGIDAGARYVTDDVKIAPGSTLVLYTDGLVERRNERIDIGINRLAELLSDRDERPRRLTQALIDGMDAAAPADDVAVLCGRLSRS